MKNNLVEILSSAFSKSNTEDKKCFVSMLIKTLNDHGYVVEKEVKSPFSGNMRINFKVTKANSACWIELDNKSPRLRSIERIHEIINHGEDGFVLLRDSFLKNYKYLGIDIVSARK